MAMVVIGRSRAPIQPKHQGNKVRQNTRRHRKHRRRDADLRRANGRSSEHWSVPGSHVSKHLVCVEPQTNSKHPPVHALEGIDVVRGVRDVGAICAAVAHEGGPDRRHEGAEPDDVVGDIGTPMVHVNSGSDGLEERVNLACGATVKCSEVDGRWLLQRIDIADGVDVPRVFDGCCKRCAFDGRSTVEHDYVDGAQLRIREERRSWMRIRGKLCPTNEERL